jgi:hypothetical protein
MRTDDGTESGSMKAHTQLIDRRRFLRNAGVVMALPVMESLMPGAVAQVAALISKVQAQQVVVTAVIMLAVLQQQAQLIQVAVVAVITIKGLAQTAVRVL